MANYRIIQNSFIGGIVSPLAEGGVGLAGYNQSLSIAENALYGPGYGVSKRHGTKYQTSFNDTVLRIVPFIFNNQSLAIAIVDSNPGTKFYICRIEKQAPISSFSLASPAYAEYELAKEAAISLPVETPFSGEDAPDLDIQCVDDKLYIVHRNIHPKVMTISYTDGVYSLSSASDVEFVSSTTSENKKTDAYTFDKEGDYPAHQLFYQGRWLLFSTINNPSAVYYSRSYNIETDSYRYNDFTYAQQEKRLDNTDWQYVSLADLGGMYINSSMNDADIRWVIQHQGAMILATGRAIYSDKGNTITSTIDSPLSLTKIIDTGAAANIVATMNSYIFFVGTDKRTVRVLLYNSQSYTYTQAIISSSVAHRINRDIKEIAVTNGIMPLIWIRTENYELLYCYFEQAQIMAWSRFTFESSSYAACIASIQGGTDGICSLAMYVRRPGIMHHAIESFDIISPDEVWMYPQVDSARIFINNGSSDSADIPNYDLSPDKKPRSRHISQNITGAPDHLSFQLSVTDTMQSNKVPFGGANYLFLGYGYNLAICTLRQELPANGTSQSNLKAIKTVSLRLYNSYGGKITTRSADVDKRLFSAYSDKIEEFIKEDELKEILYQQYNVQQYAKPHELYTGDKVTPLITNSLADDRVLIVSSYGYPFLISALIINYIYSEV